MYENSIRIASKDTVYFSVEKNGVGILSLPLIFKRQIHYYLPLSTLNHTGRHLCGFSVGGGLLSV